ncbi:polymer-forming cytoskeletal protein [uncultured Ruegeria sp.]|uniref:polymer-forming cytoskeletal protein n=2 Tax=uncultured Ruegeria sp. TaxID=259304 RepID=UPI002630805B|nr:polymer-forming cytoskeletal protein [uncultured Ruegeria sp.]
MRRMLSIIGKQGLRRPRQARRGFSLIEAIMVLLILIPVLNLGIRFGTQHVRNIAGLNEARLLTQVVDAGATLALRDLNGTINSQIGVGNAQVLDLADLEATGLWTSGSNQLTALGREVSLILHARGSEELIILARASALTGEENPRYVPRGGEGVGLVGFVPPDADDRLRGPGLDYDLSALQALTGAPQSRDVLAIRVLRMDRDVLPFLHRAAQPGFPELNEMQTDLLMNGFDLVGAGELQANEVTVAGTLQADTITGTLMVDGDVEAAGDLTVGGEVTANEATISGATTASTLTVTDQATIGTLKVEALTANDSVSVARDLVAEGTATLDALAVTDLSAQGIEAKSLTTGTLAADNVFSSAVTANTGQIQTLKTGTCSGC